MVSDAGESQRFWSNLRSLEKQHEIEAGYLKTLEEESREYKQEEMRITEEMISDHCKEVSDWKSLGQIRFRALGLKT